MNKQHMMITFDSDSWEDIRQMLGLLGQLKCKYCRVTIDKNNIGGISNPKEVFCKNMCCLARHVIEQEDKHDTKNNKNEVKE